MIAMELHRFDCARCGRRYEYGTAYVTSPDEIVCQECYDLMRADSAIKRHSEEWYSNLAKSLGHSGYVTLAEVREAERIEAEQRK